MIGAGESEIRGSKDRGSVAGLCSGPTGNLLAPVTVRSGDFIVHLSPASERAVFSRFVK